MARPKKATAKRANGLGTVWQRPTGLWAWQITLGKKPNGKRITKSGSSNTKTQANKDMTQALAAFHNGTLATPDQITVSEWLGKWLEGKEKSITANSLARYAQMIKHNIDPYLGSTKLQALKPIDIRAFHTALLESGLAVKTIRSIHGVLLAAFKQAMALELIHRNLADIVRPELPKQDNSIKPSQVWTAAETTAFLGVARGHHLYALFYLMLGLGLRRGEVCGLRWQHVDFERRVLTIEENLITIGSKLEVSSTKTRASHRVAELPHEAYEVLRLHQASQMDRNNLLSVVPSKDWLFTSNTGTVFRPDNIMRTFTALCDKAKVRHIRLHDLRHTHTSLSGRAGTPIAVISKRLGHARASFTADEYRHIYQDEMKTAALNLSELLGAAVPRVTN